MKNEHRIVYVLDDGTVFSNRIKAQEYEALLTDCLKLEAEIGPRVIETRTRGANFPNGSGYVQRDLTTVETVRVQFRELHRGHSYDPPPPCLGRLGYRLQSIDQFGREWGQPYYANHTPYPCVEWAPEANP